MLTINEDIDFNSCNDYMICGHSDEEEIFQKHKYRQPVYHKILHSKNVIIQHRSKIRNRPNSCHGFKK